MCNCLLISDDVEDEDDDDDDDDDDGDAPQLVRDPKKGFSMSSVILFKYYLHSYKQTKFINIFII